MGNNILTAITSIAEFESGDLKGYASKYLNRINAVGEQLEFYVRDAIAGTLEETMDKKETIHSKVFSYLGNQNNPPHIIIKSSDAIEIKRIKKMKSSLKGDLLKNKLIVSDSRIIDSCRNCEKESWK